MAKLESKYIMVGLQYSWGEKGITPTLAYFLFSISLRFLSSLTIAEGLDILMIKWIFYRKVTLTHSAA